MYAEKVKSLLVGSIGILGFGVEGKSTLNFLKRNGYSTVTIFDKGAVECTDAGVTVISGEHYLQELGRCTTLIRSAGVNPTLPEIKAYIQNGGVLTSQVELFFELWKNDIIGVTGTLGKGTCVSMIQDVFEYVGQEYVLGGNIGTAALDLLEEPSESAIALLELSSFQLMTLHRSPRYAIVLKTTSEHLDWHCDRDEYLRAKANLVKYQSPSDLCIYHADSEGSACIASFSGGRKMSYGTSSADAVISGDSLSIAHDALHLDECAITGVHNLENKAAVFLLCTQMGIPFAKCKEALVQFKGLKYRLQKAAVSKEGISFYNDSYATRPDATIGAIKSFKAPIMLILGGSEKHADFSELAEELKKSPFVKYIALIGATADRINGVLEKYNIDIKREKLNSLEEAVEHCVKNSNIYIRSDKEAPGVSAVVLLSPACASFGMFKNYVHRGDVFNEILKHYA